MLVRYSVSIQDAKFIPTIIYDPDAQPPLGTVYVSPLYDPSDNAVDVHDIRIVQTITYGRAHCGLERIGTAEIALDQKDIQGTKRFGAKLRALQTAIGDNVVILWMSDARLVE